MYSFGITICFCVFAVGVLSQDSDGPNFVTAPEPYVQVGDSLTLKCNVNKGALFMATKVLRIKHKSGKPGIEDSVIANLANLESKYEQAGYVIVFSYDPVVSVGITIPSVTAEIDGEYLCQVMEGETVLEGVSSPVTVLAGVDSVELTVENTLIENDNQELEFKAGQLTVGCVALGSNPAPLVYLTIGGESITADMNAILDEGSAHPRRSYKGAVTAMLDFSHDMFGKKLSCSAGVGLPDGVTAEFEEVSSSAVLNGIVDEPTIECTNNTASMGDKKITLKCKVSKVPAVKSIFFNIGNQRMVYPGNKTDDLIVCRIEDLDPQNKAIVLEFYEMEEWHFTANIYLEVLGYDGAEFRYPVYLIKEDVSGAATMAASLVVLACSLLAMMSVLESS